jgi:choline kinase
VTEVTIVVGHLGDQIRHALGETQYHGARLTYVESPDRHDGNGLSLYAAREPVGEGPFILAMADHLISPRLVRRLLAARPTQDALCVDRQPSPLIQVDEATQVWVDRTGQIRRIGKNLLRWNGLDTGVFWLTPAIFQAVETLRATGVSAPTLTQACRWAASRLPSWRLCSWGHCHNVTYGFAPPSLPQVT